MSGWDGEGGKGPGTIGAAEVPSKLPPGGDPGKGAARKRGRPAPREGAGRRERGGRKARAAQVLAISYSPAKVSWTSSGMTWLR